MPDPNRRVLLATRPRGRVEPAHFRLDTVPAPRPGPGEALLRNHYLSLDSQPRDALAPHGLFEVGEVMGGQTVARVVEDNTGRFRPGDWVLGGQGWQTFCTAPTRALTPVDAAAAPPPAYLGVLGTPGTTAWVGVTEIAVPRAGETFVVTDAAGPVGGVAGQIARRMGARAVGIAAGAAACAFVRGELGFDECVDHREVNFPARLAQACPRGIDVYFENPGLPDRHAAWPLLNDFARLALCCAGEGAAAAPGPNLAQATRRRLSMRGFAVGDYPRAFPAWRATGARWLREGTLRWHEEVVRGIERAPEVFAALLRGRPEGWPGHTPVVDLG